MVSERRSTSKLVYFPKITHVTDLFQTSFDFGDEVRMFAGLLAMKLII